MAVIKSIRELSSAWSIVNALLADGPIKLEWSKYKPSRSNEQNNYLFGVCYPPIAEAMGFDVEDIHSYMCGRHFGWVDKKIPRTPRNPEALESVPFRTTTRNEHGKRDVLGKVAFGEFVATVQRTAARAGVFIPDPDPTLRN